MTMHTEHILTLTQWLSPAYPVGAYAYSHGLEWAVEARDVTDAPGLQAWLCAVLQHGTGWCDSLFLCAAYQANDPRETDDMARAFCASSERLKETVLQGEAFAKITADTWGFDLPSLTYPVAVGRAAHLAGLPLDLTVQMYLQAFLSNLVAAGMRALPLGQTDGQRIIKALTPRCTEIATKALGATLDDLSSTAFLPDIASMKHETQYSRIFRT